MTTQSIIQVVRYHFVVRMVTNPVMRMLVLLFARGVVILLMTTCLSVLASACAPAQRGPAQREPPLPTTPRPILSKLEYYECSGEGGTVYLFQVLPDGTMTASWSIAGGFSAEGLREFKRQHGYGRYEGRQGKLSPEQMAHLEAALGELERLHGVYGNSTVYNKRVIELDGQRVVSRAAGSPGFNRVADAVEAAALSLPDSGLNAKDVWRGRSPPTWRQRD